MLPEASRALEAPRHLRPRRRRDLRRQLPAAAALRPLPHAGRLRGARAARQRRGDRRRSFFRWGLDGAFMRFWYDYDDAARAPASLEHALLLPARRSTASCSCCRWCASPFLVRTAASETSGYTLALQLVLLNTFAIGFTFIPFHVLRMRKRARPSSAALTLARSASTLVLRIVLVMFAGTGRAGRRARRRRRDGGVHRPCWFALVCAADPACVLACRAPASRWRSACRASPTASAHQMMAVGDRFILTRYLSIAARSASTRSASASA